MNKGFYIIEMLWVDSMENYDSHGYQKIGFVTNEKEAKRICNLEFREKKGYPLEYASEFHNMDKVPVFRYSKQKEICLNGFNLKSLHRTEIEKYYPELKKYYPQYFD